MSANYHQLLEIPLLSGRYLTEADDENNPGNIVINQMLAERYFEQQNPVGKRISMDEGKTWRTIRGVVGNVREQGIDKPPMPTIYSPYMESWWYELRLLISSEASLRQIEKVVNEAVHSVNPRVRPLPTSVPCRLLGMTGCLHQGWWVYWYLHLRYWLFS